MGRSLKILERMVNQNAEDEIFQDFKYERTACSCVLCDVLCAVRGAMGCGVMLVRCGIPYVILWQTAVTVTVAVVVARRPTHAHLTLSCPFPLRPPHRYWEDQSDQFREGEGSLLPLWRFSTERSKRKQVTSICWNPRYPDLFAVGYGSYDFMRQGSGMICCFSLKNTSHPE